VCGGGGGRRLLWFTCGGGGGGDLAGGGDFAGGGDGGGDLAGGGGLGLGGGGEGGLAGGEGGGDFCGGGDGFVLEPRYHGVRFVALLMKFTFTHWICDSKPTLPVSSGNNSCLLLFAVPRVEEMYLKSRKHIFYYRTASTTRKLINSVMDVTGSSNGSAGGTLIVSYISQKIWWHIVSGHAGKVRFSR
jgi:hypothetical protein